MHYTIIGDLHTKPDNLDKVAAVFAAVEGQGNTAIWLGDMLHTKELVRGRCLNFLIEQFAKSKLKHYVLVGNHDWFNHECTEHSLEPLKMLKNVQVIDCGWFSQAIKGKSGLKNDPTEVKVGFLPYMHDLQAFESAAQHMRREGVTILFAHQGISGFDYGNGYIAENEVPLKALVGLPLVVSGHFHKYQVQDNLCYLGTPFSHDFGESNQTKYIAVMSIASSEKGAEWVSQLIELNLPRHVTLTVDCDENVVETDEEYRPQDAVRVILTGSEEAVEKFDKSQFPNFKYIPRPTRVDQSGKSVVAETDSNDVKFEKWGSQVKGLSKEVLDLGLEFLRKVS